MEVQWLPQPPQLPGSVMGSMQAWSQHLPCAGQSWSTSQPGWQVGSVPSFLHCSPRGQSLLARHSTQVLVESQNGVAPEQAGLQVTARSPCGWPPMSGTTLSPTQPPASQRNPDGHAGLHW